MGNGEDIKVRAARWVCIALLSLLVYLVLKYAGGVLLPFIIAYATGCAVYPLSVRISSRTRLPRKLCAAVLLLLMLAALSAMIYFSVARVAKEIGVLVSRAADADDPIGAGVRRFFEYVGSFSARFSLGQGAAESISGAIKSAIASLGSAVSGAVGRVIAAAPSVLLGLAITLIAAIYMSMDLDKVNAFLLSLIPASAGDRVQRIRKRAVSALKAYARAYLLLFLLTFAEVLAGLLILKRQYAFLIALAVAAVDILPVFGAGAVLLPWAVISLILGNYSLGCGLLVLYGVVTAVRQIAEPKIVGKGLGLHPLALLFCMFVSLRLFGAVGVLLSPAIALLCKELLAKNKK